MDAGDLFKQTMQTNLSFPIRLSSNLENKETKRQQYLTCDKACARASMDVIDVDRNKGVVFLLFHTDTFTAMHGVQ